VGISTVIYYLAGMGATALEDATPPFQAVEGIEALYGGLTSLWQLPLQVSDSNDTLFAMYLAQHALTARQNASLAKPRPPTTPGFSESSRLPPDRALADLQWV